MNGGADTLPDKQPAAPAAAAISKPPRIKSLTLCDFRAFAGPVPVTFELDGKNLLAYGENGAGKSSVFHALDEFFSMRATDAATRKSRLLSFKNIFSHQPEENLSVSVAFDDGSPEVQWNTSRHPSNIHFPGKADVRVVNASYRKACLDYRALLDTNYKNGAGEINLFDVCVNVLLRDYPASYDGKEDHLYVLWRRLERLPYLDRMRQRDLDQLKDLASSLNSALSAALEQLPPHINSILTGLGWEDLKLDGLEMPGIQFEWKKRRKDRKLDGLSITPRLKFRGTSIAIPQAFLNEARLSALALAIYLAGRQICAATTQPDTPRLMVLDDVLIGLDQSNRMPVLRVLDEHFSDWQIILLTHDRVWYEMARGHFTDREDWAAVEMFEEKRPDGSPMPIAGPVRPFVKPKSIDTIADGIATARQYLGVSDYAAAAVHARIGFELALKKLCERKAIRVRYKSDPRQLSTEDFLSSIEDWLKDVKDQELKKVMPDIDNAITELKLWRKVVLNQFSHSAPVNLSEAEVRGAIDAVENLHATFQKHISKKIAAEPQ